MLCASNVSNLDKSIQRCALQHYTFLWSVTSQNVYDLKMSIFSDNDPQLP